jgi:hypothetical protein
VAVVHVSVGEQVETGQLLVVVDGEPAAEEEGP